MPLITGVDHDHHEVTVVAMGQVSLEDVREHLLHVRRENGPGYPKLVDLRGAGIPLEPAAFQEIAEILHDLSLAGPLGPTAFVVSTDAELEAMNTFEAMVNDYCAVKTFRGEGAARAWLRGTWAKGHST